MRSHGVPPVGAVEVAVVYDFEVFTLLDGIATVKYVLCVVFVALQSVGNLDGRGQSVCCSADVYCCVPRCNPFKSIPELKSDGRNVRVNQLSVPP